MSNDVENKRFVSDFDVNVLCKSFQYNYPYKIARLVLSEVLSSRERISLNIKNPLGENLVVCKVSDNFEYILQHCDIIKIMDVTLGSSLGFDWSGNNNIDFVRNGYNPCNGIYKFKNYDILILSLYLKETLDDYNGCYESFIVFNKENIKQVGPFLKEITCLYHKAKFSVKKDDKTYKRLFLNNNLKEEIFEDFSDFLSSEKIYKEELGLPWKRGYVFEGGVGLGKTLTIKAIREFFGLETIDIANVISRDGRLSLVTESSSGENEIYFKHNFLSLDKLEKLLYPYDTKPEIYYIEDIDKFVNNNDSSHGISYSNILKGLDGVDEINDIIIIATTNHVSDLREALINRPGRFDSFFTFESPNYETIKKFINHHNLEFDFDNGFDYTIKEFDSSEFNIAFIEEFVKYLKSRYKKCKFNKNEVNIGLEKIRKHKKIRSDYEYGKSKNNTGF